MILKNKIKKIIDAIKDTDISEIEISSYWGMQKIKLKKGLDYNNDTQNVQDSVPSVSSQNLNSDLNNDNVEDSISSTYSGDSIPVEPDSIDKEYTIIKAPLVGTFYLSPNLGNLPLLK